MNLYLILAVVIAFVLSTAYAFVRGDDYRDGKWKAKVNAEQLKATQEARTKEQMWQGVVNETAKNYQAKLAGVRRALGDDLERLRSRAERPAAVPDHPRTDCQGATGAELSRGDAEFLSREAARADEQRAGLAACYEYADALK